MNTQFGGYRTLLAVAIGASILLGACASSPTTPAGATSARARLTQLQSDPQLASLAPVEIKDAESAVRAAETPQQDEQLATHLVFMADRKIDIAGARAQARLYEGQRTALGEERATARLDARTREADNAHRDASIARSDAAMARADTDKARQEAEELQRQIAELNARETDRGLVVTLGDLLFATGRSELKGGAEGNLGKLAVFLNRYEDRRVSIEGHTDDVGSEESNYGLSQRRADSVKSYLVSQGIDTNRLQASGRGENTPVADNTSSTGRQQNRRVEVVISSNAVTSR